VQPGAKNAPIPPANEGMLKIAGLFGPLDEGVHGQVLPAAPPPGLRPFWRCAS
jgi:hypothetical protein